MGESTMIHVLAKDPSDKLIRKLTVVAGTVAQATKQLGIANMEPDK